MNRQKRRWSARVTRESDALDLERDVFGQKSPKAIAQSLKRSAEKSTRRKSAPFRSAMSMLTFYINRAGENLPASQAKVLERAKDELRKAFGRRPTGTGSPRKSQRAARASKRTRSGKSPAMHTTRRRAPNR